ncbi:MAG: hypothetical protein ABI905_07180 [Betaproteobacteria bacterium]
MKVAAVAGCIVLAAMSFLAIAGTGSAAFGVHIDLTKTRSSGICISETLSAGTGATVYVVCDSGQFVDIAPTPGRPFTGVHGGAYRYRFSSAGYEGQAGDAADPFIGAATVTAMRVYHADGNDGRLEMLVSF